MPLGNSSERNQSGGGFFPQTRWSVVQRFQQETSVPDGDPSAFSLAADELCRIYWRPVFLHVRARGLEVEDAKDITQQIFSSLFETQRFAEVTESKGRLRSFLRAVANRHVAEFFRKGNRIKRGGDQVRVPLDISELEELGAIPGTEEEMEVLFDREWAAELMDRVADKLEETYAKRDRANWFRVLFPRLTVAEEGDSYSKIADELSATESAVRVGVHRMRKRYRQLLRDEVAQTVDSEEAIDIELRALYSVLQGKGTNG